MTKLYDLRMDKMLTQEELAIKSGLSVSQISRLENGKHPPRFSTIKKLARALNVSAKRIEF